MKASVGCWLSVELRDHCGDYLDGLAKKDAALVK